MRYYAGFSQIGSHIERNVLWWHVNFIEVILKALTYDLHHAVHKIKHAASMLI